MERMEKFFQQFRQLKKRQFGTKRQIYLKTFGALVGSIILVFFHGNAQAGRQSFEEAVLYEEHIVSTGALSMVRKAFNEEENSFRMDLFFTSTNPTHDELERKIAASLVTNQDPDEAIDVEVIPVTSRYFVLFAKLPEENFQSIRVDMVYSTSSSSEQDLSFYVTKSEANLTDSSLLTTNETTLQVDAIQNDIRIQQELIEESEALSEEIDADIRLRLSQYEELIAEKKFQIGDELEATERRISTLRSTVSSSMQQLEDEKEQRKEANERIDILEKRIEDVLDE